MSATAASALPLEALAAAHGEALLDIAVGAVRHGLAHGAPPAPGADGLAPALAAPGATFVTLHAAGALRGCIGSARAWRPLAADVAANAYATAFEDSRFSPLAEGELGALDLDISLLGAPAPFAVESEEALLAALVPGRDGLILAEGTRRALFLPAVWDSVADADEFVRLLKHKAGLPEDYWSDRIAVERFETRTVARRGAWAGG